MLKSTRGQQDGPSQSNRGQTAWTLIITIGFLLSALQYALSKHHGLLVRAVPEFKRAVLSEHSQDNPSPDLLR